MAKRKLQKKWIFQSYKDSQKNLEFFSESEHNTAILWHFPKKILKTSKNRSKITNISKFWDFFDKKNEKCFCSEFIDAYEYISRSSLGSLNKYLLKISRVRTFHQ